VTWIIFFVYIAFFCWLITVLPFFKRSGLSKRILCALFLIKIIAGVAYFQFYCLPANKPGSDTWKFYNRSVPETDLLLRHPGTFARDLFASRYSSSGNLFSDRQSYWNDVKDELMVKLMALTNVFTGKNYYANIIWFNFFFFFGLIAFYRLMREISNAYKWLLIGATCLIPSFLFWCSGIHKDGLIFSALGLILYSFHHVLLRKGVLGNSIIILFSLLLVFFLRNYIVLALVPSLLIGAFIHLFPARKLFIMASAIIIGTVIIFSGKYIHPALNIPAFIVDKQQQFKKLQGGSAIETPELQATFSSFVSFFPTAIEVAFIRPFPTEKGLNAKIASLEIIVFWITLFICFYKMRSINSVPPLVWVCWLFALIVLVIIGYTVNFSGAVVRYRSLVLPLLLVPAIASLRYIIKNDM
jgi:hypothetical protein